MFCTKCGAELLDGSTFCVKCGAKATSPSDPEEASAPAPRPQQAAAMPADPPTAAAPAEPAEQPAAKRTAKRGIAIAAVIAIVAACIAVGAGIWLASGQAANESAITESHQEADASSASAGDVGASGTANTTETWTYKWIRITLPKSIASKVALSESTSGECAMVDFKVDGVRILTIETMRPKGSHGENEAKFDTYELGEATYESESVGVRALAYYKSSNGNGAAYWGDSAATELLCTAEIDMTPEELLDCVELSNKDSWVQAGHALTHSATGSTDGGSASSSGQSSNSAASSAEGADARKAFWGIWIGASKNEDEALALASEASGKGLEASVTITTDWENLNSESWYVITAGRYSSEADASAELDNVKAAGYGDAYVKYSGDHK